MVKINIDQAKRLVAELRVQEAPTFIVFAQGRPVSMDVGAMPRHYLCEMVEYALSSDEGENPATEDGE